MTEIKNYSKYAYRLLNLANYLYSIPSSQWNFMHWVGNDYVKHYNLCQTTACALGHATSMQEFRSLGLCLWANPDTTCQIKTFVGLKENPPTKEDFDANYSWKFVVEATAKIFGIDEQETEYLFVPSEYYGNSQLGYNATAKDVADRIKEFVYYKWFISE